MPVAEVATVRRGTAISAVYGTVRIEPAFVVHVRAQNSGFIQLAEEFSAGRGAIGNGVTKGQLLASIADETTARQLKQAQADLKAATERAKLPLPSEELLKAAEDNLHRLEQVVASGNVPAVEYEKAKSEANRLRGALENESAPLHLSHPDFRGSRFIRSTGRRSGHAALHRDFGNGKTTGQFNGRNDRRDEHHHRYARKCVAGADSRTACRSSIGRKTR